VAGCCEQSSYEPGASGYSGDGGPATSAELNSPWGVAVDAAGNFYIADTDNNVIRKVTLLIPTTTALSASVNPSTAGEGVTFTATLSGGEAATGTIGFTANGATLSGCSAVTLSSSQAQCSTSALLVESSVIVATYSGDSNNGSSSGSLTEVVNSPSQAATATAVNSSLNPSIFGETVTLTATVSGGASPSGTVGFAANGATISGCAAITLASSQAQCAVSTLPLGRNAIVAIYSGDSKNGSSIGISSQVVDQTSTTIAVVSSVNPSTVDETVTLTATVNNGLSPTGFVTFAANGTTVLGCFEVTLSSGEAECTTAFLPVGRDAIVATYSGDNRNAAGSGAGSQVVEGVTNSGPVISTAAGCCETNGWPGTPGFAGDGGPATSAELDQPGGVAADAAGDVYIADPVTCVIRKVTVATGVITTVAGKGQECGYSGDGGAATGAELYNPSGVALDAAGNLYIADVINDVIRKVTATTGVISTVAGGGSGCASETDAIGDGCPATSAAFDEPTGIVVDAAGNLYIADSYFCVIRKVTAATGIITTVAGLVPQGVYSSGDEAPAVALQCGYRGDGGPATSAEFDLAEGVALDAVGDIYIADMENNVVRKVTAATGVITTVAGDGFEAGTGYGGYRGDGGPATSAELGWPDGVAVDLAGNLYIADTVNLVIRKVTAATGVITTIAGCCETTGVPGTEAYSGDGGPATSAGSWQTFGVAVDAWGDVYFADGLNHVVRKVTRYSTATALSASANPSVYGQSVTFTATVSGGSSPSGAVAFTLNGSFIGGCVAVTLSAGQAQCATAALPVGTDAVVATYLGDSNNGESPSTPVNEVITKAVLTVAASNESMTVGGTVPALAYAISGFVNGDTQGTATTGQPQRSTTATSDSPAGTYPITVALGTLAAASYTFTFESGTLTISSAAMAVGVSPAMLVFPAQGLGQASTAQAITVTSLGAGELLMSSIGMSGANAGDFGLSYNCPIYPSGLAAGASCTVSVKFTPTGIGPRQAAVSIVSYAPTSPNAVFVSGMGTAVGLSPASLSFGSVAVGDSATLPVTLTNLGSAVVHLWQLDMSGSNAGDFSQTNNCGASVAGNGGCTITVKFTPSATGTRSASLLLLDDGGGSPQAVGLAGSGSADVHSPVRRRPPGNGPGKK
jgi:hypothetical protein